MSTASAHNSSPKNTVEKKPFYKDPTHMLYLSVIVAVHYRLRAGTDRAGLR